MLLCHGYRDAVEQPSMTYATITYLFALLSLIPLSVHASCVPSRVGLQLPPCHECICKVQFDFLQEAGKQEVRSASCACVCV